MSFGTPRRSIIRNNAAFIAYPLSTEFHIRFMSALKEIAAASILYWNEAAAVFNLRSGGFVLLLAVRIQTMRDNSGHIRMRVSLLAKRLGFIAFLSARRMNRDLRFAYGHSQCKAYRHGKADSKYQP